MNESLGSEHPDLEAFAKRILRFVYGALRILQQGTWVIDEYRPKRLSDEKENRVLVS